MTSLAGDTDLVAGVETRLREVGKVVRRAMLDAMPDGEPVAVAVRPDAGVPVAARQGAAPGAVSVGGPGVRGGHRRP